MSFWFPTEFGEDYRVKTLWLRTAAIISASVGNVLLVTRHVHPYTLLFALPVIWSMVDGMSHRRRAPTHPIASVVLDFLSATFLAWNIPLTVFAGLVYWSFVTIVMAFFYLIAVCIHVILLVRSGSMLWQSGFSGSGDGIKLPI